MGYLAICTTPRDCICRLTRRLRGAPDNAQEAPRHTGGEKPSVRLLLAIIGKRILISSTYALTRTHAWEKYEKKIDPDKGGSKEVVREKEVLEDRHR